jgi:calcium-dependent protein kinase
VIAQRQLSDAVRANQYLRYGKLNYTEFLGQTLNLKDQINDEILAETFDFFDSNNKGYITSDDLKAAMKKVGNYKSDNAINAMISEYQFQNKGKITFEEFREVLLSEDESLL